MANGNAKSVLKLTVEDNTKKENSEEVFVSIGDRISNQLEMASRGMFSWSGSISTQKEEPNKFLGADLSDRATLQILGVLICELQTKRGALLTRLAGLGVEVN